MSMASVGGSRSLHGASGEIYDIICGPCKNDNLERQAEHYCENCKDYLCNQCKNYHKKLTITKNHKILSGSAMPNKASVDQRRICHVYCSCSQNEEVEMYCETHNEVLCINCESIKHRKCMTCTVQDKCADYSTSRFSFVQKNAKLLQGNIKKLQHERTEDRTKLETLKKSCTDDIRRFRKALNALLDTLERNMLTELDKNENVQNQLIDRQISTLSKTMSMLDLDKHMLENARKDGNTDAMFVTDVKVSKGLQEYEALLADLQNDIVSPVLSFERNKTLDDVLNEINTFGSLKAANVVSKARIEKKVILDKKMRSSSMVHVSISGDNCTPCISGLEFIPTDHLIICDSQNEKLKLLDSSWTVKEHLKLSSAPWDVSRLDDKNVVVTIPEKKQIQYIQVLPKLKTGRVIQLDNKCFGIEMSGDEIFVTCSEEGEIRILDLNGNLKRKLGANPDGTNMFECPYYLTVNPLSRNIFISDGSLFSIVCLTFDGNVVYRIKNDEVKQAYGMYVDAKDNVFVVDTESNSIQVLTAGGKTYGTLLTSNDGIKWPFSIAFRDNDDTLVVGSEGHDRLCVFKLE